MPDVFDQYFLDVNPLPVWICEWKTKRILQVNRAAVNLSGYTAKYWTKVSFSDLVKDINWKSKEPVSVSIIDRKGNSNRLTLRFNKVKIEESRFVFIIGSIQEAAVPDKISSDSVHGLSSSDLEEFGKTKTPGSYEVDEIRFSLIGSYTSNAVIITDVSGKIKWVNQGFERLTEYSLADVAGRNPSDFLYADFADSDTVDRIRKKILQGKRIKSELVNHTRSGKRFWMDFDFIPIRDNSDRLSGYLVIGVDITSLKTAIDDLKKTQELLSSIVEHAPLSVYMKDRDGKYLLYNPHFQASLNGKLGQVLTHDYHLFDGEQLASLRQSDALVYDTGKIVQMEQEINLKGKSHTFYTTKFPLHDHENKVYAIGALALDITHRKEMELVLRESEARFRAIADSAPASLWVADENTEVIFMSRNWYEFTGVNQNPRLGDGWKSTIHPEDLERVKDEYYSAFEKRSVFNSEYRLRKADGTYSWVHDSGTPRYREDNKFVGYIGSIFDITERKEMELALRTSKELYHSVVQAQKDMICRYTPGGTYTFVNDAFCMAFSVSREDLIGKSFYQDKNNKIYPYHFSDIYHHLNAPHIERVNMNSNQVCWHEWTDTALYDVSGQICEIQSVGTDVTQRISTELEINHISTRLLLATHAAKLGIWEFNIVTGNSIWDSQLLEIFGVQDTAFTPDIANWKKSVHPDDVRGAEQRLITAIEKQIDYHSEYRIIHPGGKVRFITSYGRIQYDKGQPRALIGVSWDITDQKQAEAILGESEKRFRTLVQELSVGVMVTDPDFRILLANQAVLSVLKMNEPDILGKSIHSFGWNLIGEDGTILHEDELPGHIARATGQSVRGRVIGIYKESTSHVLYLMVDAVPVKDEIGNLARITFTFSDITERLHTERRLHESQQRLALATRSAMISVWDWDLVNSQATWDDNTNLLLGLTSNKNNGYVSELLKCIHPDDVTGIRMLVNKSIDEKTDYAVEFRIIRPSDNEIRYLKGYGTILADSSGKAVRMIGMNLDISSHRKYENNLQVLTNRLTLATRAAKLGIWDLNPKANTIIWDDNNKKIFGYTDEGKVPFSAWVDTLHPDDREKVLLQLNEVMLHGNNYETEYRIVRKDRTLSYIRGLGILTRDSQGNLVSMVGVNWDITEQKINEEKIRESEARYKSIVDDQPDTICRFDLKLELTFVNKSYANTFGTVSPIHHSYGYVDLFTGENRKRVEKVLQGLFNGLTPEPYEAKMDTRDGQRWFQWIYIPLKNNDSQVIEVQAIGQDVTKRKNLELQQAKLDKIVRESYNEIYLFNSETLQFEFANHSAITNLGYAMTQLRQMRITDLFHYPNEMALQVLLNTLRRGETDRLQLQMRHRRKDGSYYDIEALIQFLEDGQSFVAIAADITEKLNTEKKLLATIQEKEILLKEIHHRVKNNLQLISSIIYIKMASIKEPENRHFFNEMRQKIHSVALIHERLLQSEKIDKVEVSDYLGKLIHDLKTSNVTTVSLDVTTELDTVFLDIDSAIYCALIINELFTNCVKHAFTGLSTGKISIKFKQRENSYILSVSDNGMTLPSHIKPGHTDSFGMNLMDIFVKQLHGVIDITRDSGTTFMITFKKGKTGL